MKPDEVKKPEVGDVAKTSKGWGIWYGFCFIGSFPTARAAETFFESQNGKK
jgi:hypothetical protein